MEIYLESVSIFATGSSSWLWHSLLRSKSHSSSRVTFEKSASMAPARVPVASKVDETPGDQTNAAVLGITRNLTIVTRTRLAVP